METFLVIKDGATTSQTLQDPEKCYIRTQAFIVYKKKMKYKNLTRGYKYY